MIMITVFMRILDELSHKISLHRLGFGLLWGLTFGVAVSNVAIWWFLDASDSSFSPTMCGFRSTRAKGRLEPDCLRFLAQKRLRGSDEIGKECDREDGRLCGGKLGIALSGLTEEKLDGAKSSTFGTNQIARIWGNSSSESFRGAMRSSETEILNLPMQTGGDRCNLLERSRCQLRHFMILF